MKKLVMILPLVLLLCFAFSCQKADELAVDKKEQPSVIVDNAISTDGVSIAYEVIGKGEPALLFIPGWAAPRSVWEDELSHFSKKHKSVAVDLAGVGDSGNNRENWTMEAYGDDVISVIKRIGIDEVILVGWSLGGAVAIEAALKMPEAVMGIVIVDSLQDIEKRYSEEEIIGIENYYMDFVTNPTREKVQERLVIKKEELIELYLAALKEDAPKIGWRESLRNFFLWCNEDCENAMKSIQVPVVSINSDQQPTNEEAFKKLVPSFKAKIMTGVGHFLKWEAPDEFKRLLETTIHEFIQMAEQK